MQSSLKGDCTSSFKIIDKLFSIELSNRSLGVGFDCASMAEIQCTLNAGAVPEKIVYSNTVKQDSHLEYARSVGVKMMTFDNHAELMKIKAIYPAANLLLRIRVADSHSEVKYKWICKHNGTVVQCWSQK